MSEASSSYTSISNVGKTLIDLLWNSIKDDTTVNTIITSDKQISLSSPKETADSNAAEKLSLFLYRITEFSTMKNTPLHSGSQQNSPLYLTLHYLCVPYTQNAESDQILLGKIFQVFLDNSVLRGSILQGSLASGGEVLRIKLDNLTPDDLNKVWTILSTPYKITLSYTVSPVRILSSPEEEGAPVIEKTTNYEQKNVGEPPL
jgi:hypothetical protein